MPQPQHRYDPRSSDTENWTASLNQPEGIARTRKPRSPRDPRLLSDTSSPPNSSTPKGTASPHHQAKMEDYQEA
ncbi:hypothetical protein PIB30_096006, partial [Stylosanthes scabra]|nr:hypothetical protein [Stylosanthes scabra]